MYKALYRKWRPLSFDDVISQQHVTQTLKNQVINNKTAHAYLFTGSRGTGKTTCARILAKAINCNFVSDGSPCRECDICRDADDGMLSDIIEIDAASNNSVDDIRELREGSIYIPERCKYKVYIIDEVHMLSPSAFNALLKIMEEPPDYVKFILATTEIHKVPATIVSRCQRYDFRRIRPEDIAKRLLYIASQENISLTENAAFLIARLADGGMRDAISLLDQCSVCAEEITAETVSDTAGIAGRDYLYNIIEAFSEKNIPAALDIIDSLYNKSKDLTRLCEELIMQLRNLMLIKVSPESAGSLITCMPDEFEKLKKISRSFETERIMSMLDVLQECFAKMAKALNKRVEFEMTVVRLCRDNPEVRTVQADNSDVLEKIRKLEKQIKLSSAKKYGDADITGNPIKNNSFEEPKPDVDLTNINFDELPQFEMWDKIVEELKKVSPSIAGSLYGSNAQTVGNVFLITAKNTWFKELMKKNENSVLLAKIIYQITGKKCTIRERCFVTPEEQRGILEKLIQKAKNSGIDTAEE